MSVILCILRVNMLICDLQRFRTLLDDSHKNATTASAALRSESRLWEKYHQYLLTNRRIVYLVVFTDETTRSGDYDDIKAEVYNLITVLILLLQRHRRASPV